LPLPKRQCIIPSRTEGTESSADLTRQLTPSAQCSRSVLRKEKVRKSRGTKPGLQIIKSGTDGVKHLQKPIVIHRRAASMESIQKVFDFYDDEDTSNEDDEHQQQELERPTFQLIDIVEPSEVFPEHCDYCNGTQHEIENRKPLLIRNISPSLSVPLEHDQSKECNCEAANKSRHKLRSPELVKLATMRGRQTNSTLRQAKEEDGRKSSPSFGDQPGLSARHPSVSVLSCTSRSESCSYLLGPEEFPELPSDILRSCVCDEPLKSVSSCNKSDICLRVCISNLLKDVAYSAECLARVK
jgi:hypothetical protein